jgi:hypothetical protein
MSEIAKQLREIDTIETGVLYSRRKLLNAAADRIEELEIKLKPQVFETRVSKPWPAKGDKMVFLDRNGYDVERETARRVMQEGDVLTVKEFRLAAFSSSIVFEEVNGRFNSVMFDFAEPAKLEEGNGK